MENIIIGMIDYAKKKDDYELLEMIEKLVSTMAITINCPSTWRSIGEMLCERYDSESWVYENMNLWNYED